MTMCLLDAYFANCGLALAGYPSVMRRHQVTRGHISVRRPSGRALDDLQLCRMPLRMPLAMRPRMETPTPLVPLFPCSHRLSGRSPIHRYGLYGARLATMDDQPTEDGSGTFDRCPACGRLLIQGQSCDCGGGR